MTLRILAAAILGVLGCVVALDEPTAKVNMKPSSVGSKPHAVRVDGRIITSFHKGSRVTRDVGKLKWLGGLVISSSDPAFGGYSGLEIDPGGKRFLAVSDAGTWLSGELVYDRGRLVKIRAAQIGALKARGNKDLRRRWDRDAESIRLFRGNMATGTALIAFELNQRVGFFPIKNGVLGGPTRYLRPGRRLSANKGLEAVARLGRLPGKLDVIAFAERSLDGNGHHRGWLWRGARGAPQPIALTNLDGFDITDAVGLPDGRLLILERRFRWSEGVKTRIREIAKSQIRPKAILNGRTLIRADLRYEVDNMEGLAVHTDKRGRTILTLISDNNFNSFLQRTLLLQFELPKS